MQSHHRLVAIGAIIFFAFIAMCGVANDKSLEPSMVVYILLIGIPLAWFDKIGAGIKWFMEFLDN